LLRNGIKFCIRQFCKPIVRKRVEKLEFRLVKTDFSEKLKKVKAGSRAFM